MRGSCSNASCSPRPLLIRRGASRSSCMCKNIRSWLCTWLCSAFTSNPPGHHKTRTINQHNDQRARMVNPCASGNMVTSLIQQRRAGGACSSLPLALRWRVLAARHKAHQASVCRWIAFALEAAMKLRLVEQACGCSTVRSEGRLKARLCRSHSVGECLPPGTMHLAPRHVALPLQRTLLSTFD